MTTTSTYSEQLPLSVMLFHVAMERRESLNTFAGFIGVGTISLRQFILGKTQRPRQKTVDNICEILNISEDDVRQRMDLLPQAAPIFSDWLHDQIKQWGTRSKLARQTGISDGALRNYLDGRTLPDADQAMRLAEVLQIDSLQMANMVVANHVLENGGTLASPVVADVQPTALEDLADANDAASSDLVGTSTSLPIGLSSDEDHLVTLWRKLHPQGRRATVQYIATLLAEG